MSLGGFLVYRCILAKWRQEEDPSLRRSYEGEFTPERLKQLNDVAYNVYFLPNGPSLYDPSKQVDGSQIDDFRYIFVDCDLKDGVYQSKEAFLSNLVSKGLHPTLVIDSGNGVHAYWEVTDLDAMSYLRLQRRLCRFYKTDPAVSQICQLMRVPGYVNPKIKDKPVPCNLLQDNGITYTAEQLDKVLPGTEPEDEQHCQRHYSLTYSPETTLAVTDKLPDKFFKLVKENKEVADIWVGNVPDRSRGDYRLAHIMFASGFTRDESLSVLVNASKALSRAPVHRVGYAEGIVSKIYPDIRQTTNGGNVADTLSPTVRSILSRGGETLTGARFPCNRLIDDTEHGFRLGQVLGIIGGSGVGKTTLTLNTFLWFAEQNPDYHHFFFSLEQPPGEIASRIRTICGENDSLYDMIHVIGNHNEDGTFKQLTLGKIEAQLIEWQRTTGRKVGATVIDHIGVLDKDVKNGENDGLIGICRRMKPTALSVGTILIMLSQAPREKAGIGDLELNKDAAYGTVAFESFCDWILCLWQPLKRMYHKGAPTIMAFKFGKIRHKKQGKDRIQEDVCYQLHFDPTTERLREVTQEEEKALPFWVAQSTNARKQDRKTDVVTYESRRVVDGEVSNNSDDRGA